jgi:predicted nucleotidyltransferase
MTRRRNGTVAKLRRSEHAAATRARDPLALLGVPPSAARILRYFALRPTAKPHARHLQRILALGGASLQRDLARLVMLGALERVEDGRLVRYGIASDSSLWTAFRIVIGATNDPAALVRDALRDITGIEAAFVFGSTAKETRRRESDVDVLIVENPDVDRRAMLHQLAEVGMLLHCEINTVRYSLQTLADRLGNVDHAAAHFVREVLAGPKRWVAGSATALLPLATAAGVVMTDATLRVG